MTIIEWLTEVNGSYLVALALTVFLIVEGIKATERVSMTIMPLMAGLVGSIIGLIMGIIYQESLALTGLNGLIAGLLSAGSYDCVKALRRLPEAFK